MTTQGMPVSNHLSRRQHYSSAPVMTDLAKLTVAQLKALCKERKISGYSKLGKAALIEKLTGRLTGPVGGNGPELSSGPKPNTHEVNSTASPVLSGVPPSATTLEGSGQTHTSTKSAKRPQNLAQKSKSRLKTQTSVSSVIPVSEVIPAASPSTVRKSTSTTALLDLGSHVPADNSTSGSGDLQPAGPPALRSAAPASRSCGYTDSGTGASATDGFRGRISLTSPDLSTRHTAHEGSPVLCGVVVRAGAGQIYNVGEAVDQMPETKGSKRASDVLTGASKKRRIETKRVGPELSNSSLTLADCPTSVLKAPLSSSGCTIGTSDVDPGAAASVRPASQNSLVSAPPFTSLIPSVSATNNTRTPARPVSASVPPAALREPSQKAMNPQVAHDASLSARSWPDSRAKAVGKRFQKLVVTKHRQAPDPKDMTIPVTARLINRLSTKVAPLVLCHLDFLSPPPIPKLQSITLPPSLIQRKRVQRWAVILSGLSNEERRRCVLVSRMFRYAVYLSAFQILEWYHSGSRLVEDSMGYSQAMTNMWPYLRMREEEVIQRRRKYEASFLARFYKSRELRNPIADRLWSSPDSEKQVTIATRFVLSRLWFALSVGTGGSDTKSIAWLQSVVVDVQSVILGDIWSITVQHSSPCKQAYRETIYVLESTCEPVGRPVANSFPKNNQSPDRGAIPVRADWSDYIARHRERSSSKTSPCDNGKLFEQLKWANYEEYDRGISRLWLKRIQSEGVVGEHKRAVAERYVTACVIANSVSGQWMSTSEMAQDFVGLPLTASIRRRHAPRVNLYLPEHHHVESVHFTSARGHALHVALAVVQTLHREYFILRDNGMQVGCEEEGVASVWQEVIGCNALGQ